MLESRTQEFANLNPVLVEFLGTLKESLLQPHLI